MGLTSKDPAVSQAEAEAGTATTFRRWTAERVKQAIIALGVDTAVSQAEAEAGTSTSFRRWTPERVKQAIAALGGGGGGGGALADLLNANDSEFATTIGSWAAGGSGSPTVARETTKKMTGQNASLKVHVTASGGYAEVPVSGTFKSGHTYWAVLTIFVEPNPTITLGLIGTDSAAYATGVDRSGVGTGTPYSWRTYAVKWNPTADRTGVKLRVTNNVASTFDFYVGIAKVYDSPIIPILSTTGSPRALLLPNIGAGNPSSTGTRMSMEPEAGGIIYDSDKGTISLKDIRESGAVEIGFGGGSATYISQQHVAADLAEEGLNIEVGSDYVGLWISEKDSSTIQIYDDGSGSYDIELVDQDATIGWQSVSSTGVHKKLVDMESRKGSGSATITSGNTSIVVTHGAGYTPAAEDIMVCPTNSPTNDPGNFWVDTITSTQFTIHVRANPGASGAIFAWRVDR